MYTPFSKRPARVTLSGALLVRVNFRSSRRMATLTTPTIPAIAPEANKPLAASAIRAAMANLPSLDGSRSVVCEEAPPDGCPAVVAPWARGVHGRCEPAGWVLASHRG